MVMRMGCCCASEDHHNDDDDDVDHDHDNDDEDNDDDDDDWCVSAGRPILLLHNSAFSRHFTPLLNRHHHHHPGGGGIGDYIFLLKGEVKQK